MSSLLSFLLREKAKVALAAVVAIALFCGWQWQPERQVRLHQRHFLDAAENRDWPKIRAALDDNFHTSFGHDKATTLALMAEGLRPFFSLQIFDSDTEAEVQGRDGTVRTRLRLSGQGMELAQFVQAAVNENHDPFLFTWRQRSWKPWDWRLVAVAHPLIGRAADHAPGL